MHISYEEFMKIIPKETQEFIKEILPVFNFYLEKNSDIGIKDKSIHYKDSKALLLFLFCLINSERYKNVLTQSGFNVNPNKYILTYYDELSDKEEEDIFNSQASYFLIYDDETLYFNLTPLDLLIDITNKLYNYIKDSTNRQYSTIRELFNYDVSKFRTSIIKLNKEKKDEEENKIKQDLFKNLSIDTIDYLETASKIRTLLLQKKGNNNKLITNNEEDLVALSLLLAIFLANKNLDEEDNILAKFTDILNTDNVNLKNILTKINLKIDNYDLQNIPTNLYALEKEYKKYFSKENATTLDIIENLFDRNLTKSLIVEKIFLDLGTTIEKYENPAKLIDSQTVKLEKKLLLNFYKNIPKETKDFVNYASKAYILLKKEFEKNESYFITNDHDIVLLSLYLASKHFQTELNSFFEYNGITLEKVWQLLNIKIDLTEIEQQKIDYQILNKKFKNIIFSGNNKNKTDTCYINVDSLESNFCDKNISESSLLHYVFEELTGQKLSDNFYKKIENFTKEKEQQKLKKQKEEFYHDLPIDTINFLDNVSNVFTSKSLKEIDINDRIIISLLTEATLNNNLAQFMNYLGLDISKIKSELAIHDVDYTFESEHFYNLPKYFSKIIFEGCNKEKNKSDITAFTIIKNIFAKEFSNSIFINNFFKNCNLSHDIYDNFDKIYQDFVVKTNQEKKENLLCQKRASIDQTEEEFLITIIRLHQKLEKLNINPSDITSVAIILYLFHIDNSLVKFLNKNGLTKEVVFNYLNLPNDFLDDLESIPINVDIFLNYYQNISTADIKKIFNEDNQCIKNMTDKLNVDLKILNTEIQTEEDYELSLSVKERIKLLDEKPVDSLDIDNIQSVIKFGDSLGFHSQYIYDELPKLMLSDANDESIASINDTLNKVYTQKKEEKPKSLFERLFAFEVEEETTEIVLDPIAIEELKEKISNNIKKLSEELLSYDIIRKYIEVYRRKNNFYLSKILDVGEELQKEIEELSPNKEEEYADFLSVGSNLQIIKNKINRFKTSSHLMQQELVKVNQAIINHFITINALEMARDDLLPLINAELAIGKGRNTENQSLQITQNVFDLFQSLLTRNAEAAEQNMQLLQKSTLSNEIISVLSQDIETYLNGLNQARQVTQIDSPLTLSLEENEQKNLTKKGQ